MVVPDEHVAIMMMMMMMMMMMILILVWFPFHRYLGDGAVEVLVLVVRDLLGRP
jgi:phosphotransferase system  glucose/maltose/N-acetylglucosamine-specific IIC component